MAAYDYTCTVCRWTGTRYNVRMDARDDQMCNQSQTSDHTSDQAPVSRCGGKLIRTEISEGPVLPYQWGKWQKG